MNQTIGIKTCKKTSQNWTKQHKIQTISPCIFSNNFQHTKLTRNKPKSFNKNCNKNSPNFTNFYQDFQQKVKEKALNQGKIIFQYFLINLDMQYIKIDQNILEKLQEFSWNFSKRFQACKGVFSRKQRIKQQEKHKKIKSVQKRSPGPR